MNPDNIKQTCRLCQHTKWERFTLSCSRCQQCQKDYLIFEEKENEQGKDHQLAFEVIFIKENFDQDNYITFDYIHQTVRFDGCLIDNTAPSGNPNEVAFSFEELNNNFELDNLLKIRNVHHLIT